jgi:4-hydroxy-4-methyl-2-oxoglutarate aldolase
VVGLVIEAGVRDSARLREMRFPVWSKAISAQGTVKETLGDVNVPIVSAGVGVSPGDLVIADDDGVCVVPAGLASSVLEKARATSTYEDKVRDRLRSGELSLDVLGLRGRLGDKGISYE